MRRGQEEGRISVDGSSGSPFSDDITTEEQAKSLLTIEHFVDEVQTVVDYFGFDEFIICGRSWGTLKGHDSTHLLAGIDVPILYICGQFDSGTPEAAEWYISMTKDGELCVLPGCGHNASRERPEEFNAAVDAFADRASKK